MENKKNYNLRTPELCLGDINRLPGINFWFLLEQGHNNIGDIAIGVAEQRFFEQYFPQVPKHFIYEQVFEKYKNVIAHQIHPNDVIVLRGGGSIGNTILHEKHREEIIHRFKENFIISMPQTMCFPDTRKGAREKTRAANIYGSNNNLLLIAREEKSFQDMKSTFPNTNILLTPDVVMTMDFNLPEQKRNGILLCFRSDWEKSLTEASINKIDSACHMITQTVQYTDMYAEEEFIPFEKRNEVLSNKISQFKSASLVVTDRLHGMVFSAITGTPCIALSNYNHKVEETYKWLQNLPYIRYCRTVDEALESIPKMYNSQSGEYSNSFTVPYFEEIAKLIEVHFKNRGNAS